jgi:hypothetical protein
MNNLAKGIANVVAGVGELSGVLIDLRNTGGIKQLLDVLTFGNIFQLLGYLGGTSTAQPKSNFTYELGASATKDIERANEILRIKNANKLRAEENARIKAKNELDKLKEKYDVERIGLMLALNQATDEETRLRIAEKLAILDGNAAKAAQYLAETELTFQANQLAQSMNKAANAALYFSDWATYRAGERGDASIVSSAGGGGAVGVSSIPAPSMTMASDYAAYRAGERGDINITVEGSILSDQDLTDTIQRTILQINKQGRGTTPAGGLSGGT